MESPYIYIQFFTSPPSHQEKTRQKANLSIAQFTKLGAKYSTQIPPCYYAIPRSTNQIIFNTIDFKNLIIQLTNFRILKASLLLLVTLATVSLLLHCSSCFLLVFFFLKKKSKNTVSNRCSKCENKSSRPYKTDARLEKTNPMSSKPYPEPKNMSQI